MLGNSGFIEYETQPLEELPSIIAKRLQGMSFSVANVELQPSQSAGGVTVNVTLNKAANLNALFVAEQYLTQIVVKAAEQKRATFYWRYRPQATGAST
jgi:hypothetical protein